MDLSLLLPVISLIFTVVSKLLLLYSTIDKTSTLKMISFSTVRVTQRGSQGYMEKRRGRRELEVTQKKAGVAILISDKIDFKTKAVKRDKEGHYIMIKGSIQEEDITIINIYAPNTGAPQYVRQMLTSMKGEINNNTIIVGDFNTPLTPMDRSTKQKINKETQTLNDTIDQLDLIDIYRTFHPKTMNFTFFSSAHGTFSRIDHILGHKASLGKFKKIEIIPSIFSDHNAVRLDLNYRRQTIKNSNIWRLNNTLLNNQQITEEIKKEIKICIETSENENTTTQNLWDTVKAVLRGKFIAIQAHLKKQEKSQINNLTLHLK